MSKIDIIRIGQFELLTNTTNRNLKRKEKPADIQERALTNVVPKVGTLG